MTAPKLCTENSRKPWPFHVFFWVFPREIQENLGKSSWVAVTTETANRRNLAIPRSWYRAQKPLKPGNTKKIRKVTKSPTPGRAPKKTKKKHESGPKMTVFVFFLYFFRILWGPTRGGGFRDFFVFFSYFRA